MRNANIFTFVVVMGLFFSSFAVTKTNSQTTQITSNGKKDSVKNVRVITPLNVKPLPKLDTIVSKIDTISKEQIATKEILADTKEKSIDNTKKNKVITEYIQEKSKESHVIKRDTVIVTDTILVSKTIEVIKEEHVPVYIDSVRHKRSFFQKLFPFIRNR